MEVAAVSRVVERRLETDILPGATERAYLLETMLPRCSFTRCDDVLWT
jgi:hypothetical protein